MAAIKFLNLLAAASLAILTSSFGITSVNALSDPFAANLLVARHHAVIAKRNGLSKRTTSLRCKARPQSTSSVSEPSSIAAAPAEATPSPESSSGSSSNSGSSSGSSGSGSSNSGSSSGSSGSGSSNSGSSSSGSSGNSVSTWGKTGTAWPNGDANPISLFKPASGATYYTWSPHKASQARAAGFKFAAMLWGWKQVSEFQQLVGSGYADIILGMNEPNEKSQSNMTPESGAELWKTYIEPLKYLGYTLISPACTSAPSGKVWIQNFIKACNGGCTLDAIAVHYYDTSADHFIGFIEDYHSTFNKDIWVTEFACQNFNGGRQATMDEIWAFMIKTVQWMDNTDYIKFYAWFGAMRDMQNVNDLNRLMTPDGNGLTDLGRWYVGNHA